MLHAGYASDQFEWLEVIELDTLLQQFYASVRTKEGNEYSKSALVGLRAGINRHVSTPPISRNINIMRDRDFRGSNQVLTGLIKGLKREGKDKSTHKEPVTDADLEKLYTSELFSEDSPRTLQNKVMFDILAQFGRRGREGLNQLKKQSFAITTDSQGHRYVKMTYNEADKTHHGIDNREKTKEPRMYETNGPSCPLRSFEKYMSKLNPNRENLFQRPLQKFQPNDEIWYADQAVGVNAISGFMARMSKEAQLSRRYTNHCVRAYVSTTLHNKGFSNAAIMSVTGHRNESSLTHYIKPTDDERHQISKALSFNGARSGNSDSNNTSSHFGQFGHDGTVADVNTDNCSYPDAGSLGDRSYRYESYDLNMQNKALSLFTGNITSSTINVHINNPTSNNPIAK